MRLSNRFLLKINKTTVVNITAVTASFPNSLSSIHVPCKVHVAVGILNFRSSVCYFNLLIVVHFSLTYYFWLHSLYFLLFKTITIHKLQYFLSNLINVDILLCALLSSCVITTLNFYPLEKNITNSISNQRTSFL